MRKYLFLALLLAFGGQLIAQNSTTAPADGAIITFEKNTHDFGDIVQGDKVDHTFYFSNTGNEPLIITDVQVTCGCTVPKWPRDPIPPGANSELTVSFNSAGKIGRQNKTVTIVSNAANPEGNRITFTTNILDKATSKPQ